LSLFCIFQSKAEERKALPILDLLSKAYLNANAPKHLSKQQRKKILYQTFIDADKEAKIPTNFEDIAYITRFISKNDYKTRFRLWTYLFRFGARIDFSSNPSGEDRYDVYNQRTLVNFEEMNGTTLVELITALALSTNFFNFSQNLLKIRYQDINLDGSITEDDIRYTSRNHFTSLEWRPNALRNKFYEDITSFSFPNTTVGEAKCLICKKAWYKSKKETALHFSQKKTKEQKTQMLAKLHKEGESFPKDIEASIPYLKIDSLFQETPGKELSPNLSFFKRIATPAIVNIVRPDWNLKKFIGTNINVYTQAILITDPITKKLRVFYITQDEGIIDQDFAEYLKKWHGHETIKGINILALVDDREL